MTEVFTKTKNVINTHLEFVIYILLGLLTFFLSTHFSKDWYYYQYYFDKKIEAVEWVAFLNQITIFREALYLITTKFFGQLFGFSNYILVSTVVLLVLKLSYLKKLTQLHYSVGLFFYLCFYLFLFEGTQLRVAYASTLIILALYFLFKDRTFLALCMIVLASQIHLTALVFLIIFPLYYFKKMHVVVYLLIGVAPLFILFDFSLFGLAEAFITKLNPKYIYYFEQKTRLVQNSTGLYLHFICFFSITLFIVYFYLKGIILQNRFVQVIFSTGLCGVIAMSAFHDYVAVGARLGELLLLPIVILLSFLYHYFSLRKMKVHQTMLMTISLVYFSARVLYLYPTMFNL